MSDKKCVIVINHLSGGYKSANEENLKKLFGKGFDTSVFHIESNTHFKKEDVDRVVVCGGDGTFNSIINLYRGTQTEIVYCPFGTLNETSKNGEDGKGIFVIDVCGGTSSENGAGYFSYVLASGTFTPLGYTVDKKAKQKFKSLAYVTHIAKQLKVSRINATLGVDNKQIDKEEYCLIMALHSKQCFGLRFNRMFKPNDEKMYLLTIKSPKHNGLLGLIEMFFSYFRAFFGGFSKPYSSKKMTFTPFENLHVTLDNPTDFCVDGEKWTMPTSFTVTPITLSPKVKVYTQYAVNRLIKYIK